MRRAIFAFLCSLLPLTPPACSSGGRPPPLPNVVYILTAGPVEIRRGLPAFEPLAETADRPTPMETA